MPMETGIRSNCSGHLSEQTGQVYSVYYSKWPLEHSMGDPTFKKIYTGRKIGTIATGSQGLLLVLSSEAVAGTVQGNICGTGDSNQG